MQPSSSQSATKFGKPGKVTAQQQSSQLLHGLDRLLQPSTVLTGHLPSTKKKKKETGYRLPHVKSYTKSETILHQCWSAAVQIFCHQYPTSSAADAETVLAAGENPELQNKLKSQSKWGYNHGSLIIHYYKPLISLCLSFTAWVLNIYFWCT